jgi:hypothetical protein
LQKGSGCADRRHRLGRPTATSPRSGSACAWKPPFVWSIHLTCLAVSGRGGVCRSRPRLSGRTGGRSG